MFGTIDFGSAWFVRWFSHGGQQKPEKVVEGRYQKNQGSSL